MMDFLTSVILHNRNAIDFLTQILAWEQTILCSLHNRNAINALKHAAGEHVATGKYLPY